MRSGNIITLLTKRHVMFIGVLIAEQGQIIMALVLVHLIDIPTLVASLLMMRNIEHRSSEKGEDSAMSSTSTCRRDAGCQVQCQYAFIAKTPLQSRKSLATLTGVMCSTSQCELRSTFPNLRVTNVIRIVTYYTLPPLESPDSSWMTRSQRSRRRDKGLLREGGAAVFSWESSL